MKQRKCGNDTILLDVSALGNIRSTDVNNGPKRGAKNQTSKEREIPLSGKTARGSRVTLYKKNGARITLIRVGFP